MSDSMWKKEISFGRKKAPADDAAPAAAEQPPAEQAKPSVLKKEISFRRKKAPAEVAAPEAAAAEVPVVQPKQSVLKREISFGRKKAPAEVAAPTAAAAEVPVVQPKQSVLKKEISFGRKKRDKDLDQLVQEATESFAPSFGEIPAPSEVTPTATAEAAVAAMPDADVPTAYAAPVVELHLAPAPLVDADLPAVPPPLVVEAAAPEPAPLEAAEQAPVSFDAQPVVPAYVEPAPAPVSPFVPEAAPVVSEPFSFEPAPAEPAPAAPAPFEPVSSEPAPVESDPAMPVPELPLDPVAVVEPVTSQAAAPLDVSGGLVTEPVAPAAASSAEVLAFPEPPAAPEEPQQPAARVALPPIQLVTPEPELPAHQVEPPQAPPFEAALPPLQPELPPFDPAEALPAEPVAVDPWLASPELPPVPEAVLPAAVQPPVPASALPPVVEPKVPFWKKQVSLSRKTKAERADEADAFDDPPATKVPFWKKQVSFSRKPKAPAEIAAAATAPAAPAAAPAAKTPWWKKELGGKKTAAASPAAAPVVAAGPAEPFWKRGFSMPKLPSLGGSKGGGRKGAKGMKGMKGNIVGLKIGASQIAAARVSNNGVAALEQVARQALPMGIVVGGELRDPDALTEALKVFFAKNKLPKKGVRLGIANNRIGVRIFDIAGVSEEKQLANAIHFRAQEALPIPLDEAVLDYHVVDESVDSEGKSIKRVLLVVAYRELIDRYVGACRKAGITLAGIDLEAFALLRSLAAPADGGTAALVAVSIGYDRSTFAVSDGRVCEFTRVLEWGGWTLNVALARAFDTAPSEVEALKCGLSLDGTTAPEGLSAEQTATAVETVRRQVQMFARELVSSLQFYQNQPGSLGIGEIVITGGTAELPGLAAELERLIGVKVRVGDPFARLKVGKKVAASVRHSGSLAVAIGLGIED